MKVIRNSLDTVRGPSDWFTGAVFIDTVAEPTDDCSRTRLHGSLPRGARDAQQELSA